MSSIPFPQLTQFLNTKFGNPPNGLTFPWTDKVSPDGNSVADVSMTRDGVSPSLQIIVKWTDLNIAVQQLLGFSQRVVQAVGSISNISAGGGTVTVFTNIIGGSAFINSGPYVTITGISYPGPSYMNGIWPVTTADGSTLIINCPNPTIGSFTGTGVGATATQTWLSRTLPFQSPLWPSLWCTGISSIKGWSNQGWVDVGVGPKEVYEYALLTLQFSRPLYNILPDNAPNVNAGISFATQQEWNRYTDKLLTPSIQMLSRRQGTFQFAQGVPIQVAANRSTPGSVGTKVAHVKWTRKWYQLPELAVYNSNGFLQNLFTGGPFYQTSADNFSVPGVSSGYIPSPNLSGLSSPPCILASVNQFSFFGAPRGVLLYEIPEVIPHAPQIPSSLLNIVQNPNPPFWESLPLQYDVVLHFDYFDPPVGPAVSSSGTPLYNIPPLNLYTGMARGQNCLPFFGDGYWYLATTLNSGGSLQQSIFPYYDFSKIFQIS